MFDGIEWGTVGEWFGGIGGLLAVGVASWFAWKEHKRAEDESDRADRAELLHGRQMATRLSYEFHGAGHMASSYLLDRAERPEEPFDERWSEEEVIGWRMNLINEHREPFDNVIGFASWPDRPDVPDERIDAGTATVAGPMTRRTQFVAHRPNGVRHNELPQIALEFSDADGRRWRRKPDGGIEPVEI